MKILLVDDKDVVTELLASLVKSMGHEYVCANNGLTAYELFCKDTFDLVITDLMMPEMKGEELIRKLKEINKEIIIIAITGYATIEAAIEVMKDGAFDFIKKPFHIDEVKLVIEKAIKFHDIQEKNKKYSEEMKIACGLRNNLLYHSKRNIPGLIVGVGNIFLEELGGDVYNIIPIDENQALIYVGDVSNRGVSASLLFSIVHSIINELIPINSSPKEILNRLNASLQIYLGEDSCNFVTILIMKLNLLTNQLTYASAGHSSPLLFRDKKLIPLTCAEEVFLGMFANVIYTEQQIQLQKYDRLILFTDGLIEARNPNGEMFELERLKTLIGEYEHLSCQVLAKMLLDKVRLFQNGAILKDDASLLILDITGEREEEVVPIEESTTKIINMEIPSVLKYRKGLIAKILFLGNELGMSNERLQDLKLIIDEAVINAIEHGNKKDRDKRVFVKCLCQENYLEISVRDEGEGYVPESLIIGSPNDLSLRGRGLLLIKQFADKVSYNPKGNEITIGYSVH